MTDHAAQAAWLHSWVPQETLDALCKRIAGGTPLPGTESRYEPRASQSDEAATAEAIASQHGSQPHPVDWEVVRKAVAAPIPPKEASASLWRPVEGKFGKTRDGRKVESLEFSAGGAAYPWIGKISNRVISYLPDGSHVSPNTPSSLDLISEWTDADDLDAEAIYADDPARLVGSVWRDNDGDEFIIGDMPIPEPEYSHRYLKWPSVQETPISFEQLRRFTLLRLSSQEAAE